MGFVSGLCSSVSRYLFVRVRLLGIFVIIQCLTNDALNLCMVKCNVYFEGSM